MLMRRTIKNSRGHLKHGKKTDIRVTYGYIQVRDQYQYLGNCPPTPPLTQQQSIDDKSGLMLG